MNDAVSEADGKTPWSSKDLGPEVVVGPGRRWESPPVVAIPGSKSLTNRALLLAALARGRSVIAGILRSDDSYWCVRALQTLGVRIAVDGTSADIEGIDGCWPASTSRIYVGSAGTAARFVPPALCLAEHGEWHIDASEQMRRRPMAPLFAALTSLGARVTFKGARDHLPVVMSTSGLKGGALSIPGSQSSQFLSGV